MLDTYDLLLRASICHDINELEEIIEFSDDINENRPRLMEIMNRLAYLLIDEG